METINTIQSRIDNGERITVKRAMELLGLAGPGIDTALPQAWVNACHERTGEWANGNVVMSYRPEHGSTCIGTLVPLTAAGKRMIDAMATTQREEDDLANRRNAFWANALVGPID
jgi:hypothetical protein